MNETSFLQRREGDWQLLTRLCDRADASPAFLETDDFHQMIRCYRRVSADLALVRTKSTNEGLTLFLNDLVGRAYGILYRSPRKPMAKVLSESLATVAQTVRRRRHFVLAAVLMFAFSIAWSSSLLTFAPATRPIFIPARDQANFKAWTDGLPNRSADESTIMTGFYASNNPRAAVMTSSLAAATFGLGTVYVIYETGVQTGALGHEMAGVGKLPFLIFSLLPHGLTEISGFILASTAGLSLGWALINPGRRSRGEALALAGQDAIVLTAASVIMMFMAAPIEGFFSFNTLIPLPVKALAALIEASAWAAFWIGYGRSDEERKVHLDVSRMADRLDV